MLFEHLLVFGCSLHICVGYTMCLNISAASGVLTDYCENLSPDDVDEEAILFLSSGNSFIYLLNTKPRQHLLNTPVDFTYMSIEICSNPYPLPTGDTF